MGTYQAAGDDIQFDPFIYKTLADSIPLVILFKNVLKLPSSSIWYAMIISNFAAVYIGTILYTRCKFQPRVKLDYDVSEGVA